MKHHKWSIYEGTRHIDSGTVQAESERDALREILSRGSELPIQMDKCYRVTVGDTTMSSYGDEFIRSAEVTGWGEDAERENLDGGHLFNDPVIQDLDEEALERIAKAVGAKVLTESLKKLIKATIGAGKSMEELGAAMDHDEFGDDEDFVYPGVNHGGFPFIPTDCGYDQDRQRDFNENLGACGPMQPCPADGRDHDLNDNAVNPTTGEIHSCCKKCGWIEPKGTGKMANDPYGGIGMPYNKPLGAGTDRIIGRALHNAKKGEDLEIVLDPGPYGGGGGTYKAAAQGDIPINGPVRVGASGGIYPPARDKPLISNHLPYVGSIEKGVGQPIQGPIVGKANLQCEQCGNDFEVTLPGTGPWSGIPCPHCSATYAFERD